MKITFLGTGTSVGVPAIGCECPVCVSGDSHNKRMRTSLYLQAAGKCILVDTSPDFRQQAITFGVKRIDAVLFTHSHADHIFGLDDIRRFNTMQEGEIPAYASPETMADLLRVFNYIGKEKIKGVYRPRIDFREIDGPFSEGDVDIIPLDVEHDPKHTFGFLFRAEGKSVGYFPDCHAMSDQVVEQLKGIDVMILDALRHRPHNTHLTVENSIKLLKRIGAKSSYITHLCHDLDHDETQSILPEGIYVSYDGLEVMP